MDTGLHHVPSENDDQPRDSVPSAAEREAARVEGIKDATLGDMAEMRAIGMRMVRRLDKRSAGEMSAEEEKGMKRVGDDCVAFERTTRAVRQIIALEHETVGIRPMPRYGEGGSRHDGSDRRGGGGEGRERLRTGSTRGYRNDLKDRPDRDREKQELLKEADAAFGEQITRIDAAAGLDLEAGGMGAEAAKASGVFWRNEREFLRQARAWTLDQLDVLQPDQIQSVVTRYPRRNMKEEILHVLSGESKDHPHCRAAFLMNKLGFAQLIMASRYFSE